MNDTKFYQESNKSVLVISDLADNVNLEDLEFFFEEFKNSIVHIQFNRTNYSNMRNPSATIIFKEIKEAEKAKNQLNMKKMKGKTVRITWHERDSSLRYSNSANIYVKNIPPQVTAREFYQYFSTFGEILSAKLSEDENGNHLGYGYVNFASVESKEKCMNESNNKEVWTGSKLSIEAFQRRQERNNVIHKNLSIFMKNFPNNYDEKKLRELIEVDVPYCQIMSDQLGRKYAIIQTDNEQDSAKIKSLNNKMIEDQAIFVDNLMNKTDRKRYLLNKINDNNNQLNKRFRECNLFVKNVPNELSEDKLKDLFGKFGEIKSLKIPETTICTKDKGKLVEIKSRCGFAYVCFMDSDSAKSAFEELNNKILDGFKIPLIIEYFMPKIERNQRSNNNNKKGFDMMMNWDYQMSNQQNFGMMGKQNMNYMGGYDTRNKYSMNQYNPTNEIVGDYQQQNQMKNKNKEEIDYNLVMSLEDDNAKKDYLGEFIFRKIESHKLTDQMGLSIEQIGKITGMILGIEDTNEIIDICRNNDNLTSRIVEATGLMNLN